MAELIDSSGTEDIFNGRDTPKARKTCPQELWRKARSKLLQIQSAVELNDLRRPPGNRLEKLEGDRSGQYSIRINSQYRICFKWTDSGATSAQIVDYH